jgi:PKD repeat protein
VTFTDQTTGSPTAWSWDFGDGGTSTLRIPSHTYTSAGTYTVTLTATNSCGSYMRTKTNYIIVCTVPVANFTGSTTSGPAPLTVTFTDQTTGSPTAWSWDFGDGGTSMLRIPSHTYTSAGTYTVKLTATNSCGSNSLTRTNYVTVSAPNTVYVSPSGTSGNTGVDWAHAVPTIQEAINLVSAGGQIWVKAGTYSLTSTITISKSVSIYGGFNGTETALSQRNPTTNVTTVDGQSTVRCFTTSGASSTVTIDGLTIQNGYSPADAGGGILSYETTTYLNVANCTFSHNNATQGGGICHFNDVNTNSVLNVNNCQFQYNTANTSNTGGGIFTRTYYTNITGSHFVQNDGGGGGGGISCMCLTTSNITITGCTFDSNHASSTTSAGGGILCWKSGGGSLPTATCSISDCFVYGNSSYLGAGIDCQSATTCITNCVIYNNNTVNTDSNASGGAIGIWDCSTANITNCTIYGNTSIWGGGVYLQNTTNHITNSIMWGNTSSQPSGSPSTYYGWNSVLYFDYSDRSADIVCTGVGCSNPWTNNISTDPSFVNAASGDFRLNAGSLCINHGSNSASCLLSTDILGNSRIIGGTVDMGAYEQ